MGELARVLKPGGVLCLWEPGVERLRRGPRPGDPLGEAVLAGLHAQPADGQRPGRSSGPPARTSFLVPAAAAKSLVERGESSSDLARHQDGLGGVLSSVAKAERAFLRHRSLPFGLSVLAVGRKPLP